MTVKELIEKLKQFNPDAEVEIAYKEEYLEGVEQVREIKPIDELRNRNVVIIQNY